MKISLVFNNIPIFNNGYRVYAEAEVVKYSIFKSKITYYQLREKSGMNGWDWHNTDGAIVTDVKTLKALNKALNTRVLCRIDSLKDTIKDLESLLNYIKTK